MKSGIWFNRPSFLLNNVGQVQTGEPMSNFAVDVVVTRSIDKDIASNNVVLPSLENMSSWLMMKHLIAILV